MTKSGKSTRKQFLLTDMFRKKEQISAICRKVNGYGPEKGNHLYFHTPSEPPLCKGDSRDVKNKK